MRTVADVLDSAVEGAPGQVPTTQEHLPEAHVRLPTTDEEVSGTQVLVEGARRGEPEAWESLYCGLYPRLKAYMARRTGFENAEDAVNETMARAVAGIERFELGPAGFDGWVFGIARRVAADHHRSAARVRRQGEAGHKIGRPIPADDAPEEGLALGEDHERVRSAFLRLSPKDREILELRVVAELSVEEVASVLGKRPGAVRTAQSRALGRLRKLMGEAEDAG